jgi:serine/threonine protein kinase, bacterial
MGAGCSLDYAPQTQLRHADIKLIDLGISQRLQPRKVKTGSIGTPSYMAPEMTAGMPWDSRADLWSVGCTLFKLYTGNTLFPFGEYVGFFFHFI